MSHEYVLTTFFAAFVAACFVYVLRFEKNLTLRLWGMGWWCVLVFATLTNVRDAMGIERPYPLLDVPVVVTATALSLFMLGGAYAYTRRTIPRWLIPLGVIACAARGVLTGLDHHALSGWISFPVEVGGFAGAAALYTLNAFSRELEKSRGVTISLALTCLAAAVWEGASAYATVTSLPVFDVNMYASVVFAVMVLVQLLAVLSQVRRRETKSWLTRERDLELLRRITTEGVRQSTTHDLVTRVLSDIRKALKVDMGGIWLVDKKRDVIECVSHFGITSERLQLVGEIPMDNQQMKKFLGIRRSVISDDIWQESLFRSLEGEEGPKYLRGGALIPLRYEEESIGFFFIGLQSPRQFPEDDHALIFAIAGELSLAIHSARAIEDLERERLTLRSVLDTSPVGVVVEDRDRNIAVLSQLAAEHFDFADSGRMRGEPAQTLFADLSPRIRSPLDPAKAFQAASCSARGETLEITIFDPENRTLLISTNPVVSPDGESLGRIWVSRNITEERALESQLRQSQKLDTLGRLAGGLAHDFNNQLTAILGNAAYVLKHLPEGTDLSEAMTDLQRAAEHSARLTKSLLSFSRRAPVQTQFIAVAELLGEVRELLRPLLPSIIDLQIEVEPNIDAVAADSTQLQQVIMNLAINARDAINGAGTIRIEARNHLQRPGDRQQPFVEFLVIDDGPGMAESILEVIFEPFFTTKEVGEGTGLGLAIAYGVVTGHGGSIDVESHVGLGTTFCVLMPSAEEESPAPLSHHVQEAATGGETILLADDEPGVRRFVTRVLEQRGFQVIEAEDGTQALELFAKHRDQIDLVFLDMTMPKLGGAETLRAIREQSPNFPAILTSGNPSLEISDGAHDYRFLQKPFGPNDLATAIRSTLDEANGESGGE